MNNNQTKRIAIQGGYGAFHDIAANHYFKESDIEIVPCETFNALFESLDDRKADYGIMAIENMVAGGILSNYKLMQESNLQIIGEVYLRISQNLVALKGQKIEDLKEVFSHPMAIMQCQKFFSNYPHIKLVDSFDTALSAKRIHDEKLEGIGAISSFQAADMYNLEILGESIESNKKNYTRFLILTDKDNREEKPANPNKASISFTLAHKIGSLAKILSIFSFHDINLTKIQSFPIIGKGWDYHFYVDVEFSMYSAYYQSLEAIRPFTSELCIFGEYEKGKEVI